jgi:hypothetical protein
MSVARPAATRGASGQGSDACDLGVLALNGSESPDRSLIDQGCCPIGGSLRGTGDDWMIDVLVVAYGKI